MRQIRNYVGGRFVDGAATFADIDPTTGATVAEVHEAGEAVVHAAVAAARAAHDGPWARTTVAERCGLLRRLADLVGSRAEDLVRAEVADTGKPEAVARTLDVARAAANFRS
ncbi:MAG: aldehyde dehydrogenase family protein, partial [Pseudonocardia sp.]